jgi:hypothetical protein
MTRTVPPLPTVTLPESGYTVEFRPIGPLTINEISKAVRKELPAPEVPLNEVTGLDGKPTQEPNEADPEYQQALAAHEQTVGAEIGRRMMRLIARRIAMTEADAEVVQQIRADMLEVGVDLEPDDADVFLNHVLIGGTEDIQALQAAVMRRSQPTQEAIQEKAADFPGEVPAA